MLFPVAGLAGMTCVMRSPALCSAGRREVIDARMAGVQPVRIVFLTGDVDVVGASVPDREQRVRARMDSVPSGAGVDSGAEAGA